MFRVIAYTAFVLLGLYPTFISAEDENKQEITPPAAQAIVQPVAVSIPQAEVKPTEQPASALAVSPAAEVTKIVEKKPAAPVFEKGSIGEILADPKEKFASFMDISPESVKAIYKTSSYKPLWIRNGQWSERAKTAIAALHHSAYDGLFPQDYDVNDLPLELNSPSKEKQNDLDVNLTSALMQYIVDVRFGRRELRKSNEDRTKAADPDPKKYLVDGLHAKDFAAWLAALPPQRHEYQALKQLLASHLSNASAEQLPPVPAGNQLRLGEREERVKTIHDHLLLTGDMPSQPDDMYMYTIDTQEGIKSFQARHHIKASGELNPATRLAMNRPSNHMVHKIVVNMERWRWLPHNVSHRNIMVNVAGFMLYGFENSRLALEKKVIVGNEYRQTPIFSAPMTNVKFNPTWTVPPKIAAKDLLPQIQANPNFLNEFGMQVLSQSGQRIDPSTINWGAYNSRNFPYTLHQNPGSTNALGKIRFTIDNPYNVYLHDTNAREKFKSDVRTLSSGCIRVQDPEELACFVMGDQNRWGIQNVKYAMQGTRTNVVSLPEKIDVHMVYATVFVDPHGKTHFYNDVYNRDNHLMRLLSMDQKWANMNANVSN